MAAYRRHPPSFSKISPTLLQTASNFWSRYLGATKDSPMGIPLSPLKPGILTTGVCKACELYSHISEPAFFSLILPEINHIENQLTVQIQLNTAEPVPSIPIGASSGTLGVMTAAYFASISSTLGLAAAMLSKAFSCSACEI